MSLHQHPDSVIQAAGLTSEQRNCPQTQAAIGLHEIALALSGAGFEVYSETWQLHFHEPARKGLLGLVLGRKPQFWIRAYGTGFAIRSTDLGANDRETVEGDKDTILGFVAKKFPKRPLFLKGA